MYAFKVGAYSQVQRICIKFYEYEKFEKTNLIWVGMFYIFFIFQPNSDNKVILF